MDNAAFQTEVDKIGALQWNSSLGCFQDANIYQTWAYGAIRWGERNVSHIVLKRDDNIVAMAQVLVVRPRHLHVGMAHLRWGPLCHLKGNQLESEIVLRMATAMHDEYVKKRGLFLRVLPKAYLQTPRAKAFQAAFEHFRSESFRPGESYRTFDVDLTASLESIRKKLDQKWRNQLNRAERNDLVVKFDDEGDPFPAFARLLDEMLARKQFAVSSDIREFSEIQRYLPLNQKMKVFLCEKDGKPIAGLVGSAMGDTGVYLFGATNEQGMAAKGSYLLQWRMIEWLKQLDVTHYDLGGISPERNPGVYHFKQGLSGNDVRYLNPLISCDSFASKLFAQGLDLAGGRTRRTLTRLLGGSKR